MAQQDKANKDTTQYNYPDKKRKNNPPVGLVTPVTYQDSGKKTCAHAHTSIRRCSGAGRPSVLLL